MMKKSWVQPRAQSPALLVVVFWVLSLFGFASELKAQANNSVDAQGKKHGAWVKYHEGGKVMRYQGQFQHGIPVGNWTYLHPNGQKMAEMRYRSATGVCKATEYTEEGNKAAVGVYTGPNQKDSAWTYFRPDGSVLARENYAQGQPSGLWVTYYPNGKTADETRYAGGVRNGAFASYTEDGKLRIRCAYQKGTLDGLYESFDINGKLRFKGMYSKGLKSGIWIYFEDGRTVRTETYKGGRLTKTDKR
ncbi:MAG: toxin-antitoxin system YwqK family antitoxin [Schleiferiaceae bacterium]|nr:toxin-antitoxin system YwqK family antitoxin [Schleiferiaceae bacterium]MDP4728716.1 toxin-antitoxin system YwqK family antitoxin [Schleiferiaceae bacterium]MDP4750293.1 toxin-antitoxin system YwqK family antitoxin [Schleiferiaceae bacterium]